MRCLINLIAETTSEMSFWGDVTATEIAHLNDSSYLKKVSDIRNLGEKTQSHGRHEN